MTAQIIEKAGKKEFAVIPYKQYLKMHERDPKNRDGQPFEQVARKLGLL